MIGAKPKFHRNKNTSDESSPHFGFVGSGKVEIMQTSSKKGWVFRTEIHRRFLGRKVKIKHYKL